MAEQLGAVPTPDTQVEVTPQPVADTPIIEAPPPPRVEAPPAQPKRRRQPATSSGFPWERSPLAQFSMAELLSEIDTRHARAASLRREQARILKQMAAIEAELEAMGITMGSADQPASPRAPAAPRRPRARNSVTLADAIAMAVEPGATVTPAEAAQLVRSNGFVTNSRSFNVQVTNALSTDPRFRRVGRGQYERIAA